MSETIKAIETYYNGYRFRSRLEARWAVFFDTVGITYEYEPEGFNVDGECYLPDFYLPKFDVYAEVKPPTEEAWIEVENKCFDFITWGGKIKAIIILSEIPNPEKKDIDVANFPIIYWSYNSPRWGWWYWWIDGDLVDNGPDKLITRNFYFINGAINTFITIGPFDLKYRSSIRLESMERYGPEQEQDDWIYGKYVQKRVYKDRITVGRELLIGFLQARKARFEHGETPQPEKLSMWKRYGIERPGEES